MGITEARPSQRLRQSSLADRHQGDRSLPLAQERGLESEPDHHRAGLRETTRGRFWLACRFFTCSVLFLTIPILFACIDYVRIVYEREGRLPGLLGRRRKR